MSYTNTSKEELIEELAELRRWADNTERIAHLGDWEWDIDSGEMYWSDEMCRIFGLLPGEVTPNYETVMGFIHPDDREFSEQAIASSLETGEPYHIENRIVRVDGSDGYVISRGEVQFGENNQPVRMTGTIQDITDRKLTENQLLESRELVQHILDAIPDILYVYDHSEQKNVYANDGLSKVLGYTQEEIESIVPEFNSALVHPEDRDLVVAHMEKLAKALNSEIIENEYRVKDVTGGWRWLHSRDVVFRRTADGTPIQHIGIAQDITDRKLFDEQRVQAQKMEAIGTLAGGIAHDFNNLLTAIMGFTELSLMRTELSSPVNDFLQQANIALERARNLVRQLLSFSRHDVITPRATNLNDLVFGIQILLRRVINESIEIVTLPGSDLWMVRIDSGQMEQVLVNLAVNARDAMLNDGKLTIITSNVVLANTLSTQVGEIPAGEYVSLKVRDTGTGMAEDVKARAFEPYFTTKEVGKGSGLGLSTCYGIVSQSGGHITIDSELGEGTSISIYLPRVEGEAGALPIRGDSGYLPTGDETILVVEDEPMVLEMTAFVLREQGYTVLEAINGVDALAIARERSDQPVHLLLTDVVMPLMGGSQLARDIKEIHPEAKTLFTSGYNDDTVLRQITLEDDIVFLQKPFTPAILALRIRETLDRD